MVEKVKDWGTAITLYEDERCRIVKVHIRKGWQCSIHTHQNSDNEFLVLSGLLEIVEHPNSSFEKIVLAHGDGPPVVVRRKIPHCFRSRSDVVALEIYRAAPNRKCEEADIQRIELGRRICVS